MHDLLVTFCKWLESSSWSTAMGDSPWMYPAIAVIHFFSIFLLVGTIAVVDLRLLGRAGRRQSVTQLAEQLFPWTWTALSLAVLSGFLLFSTEATVFFASAFFGIKLLVILLGLVFGLVVQRNVRKWDQLPAIPILAKFAAFISLALWIGVILAAVEIPNYAAV